MTITTLAPVFPAGQPNGGTDSRKETAMTIAPFVLDFLRDESGQDLIEYGLILGVMALALIASMDSLANSISNFFNKVGNTL
ncbi:MAG: Flp family type IVb pilin [Acidobacteriaceae bacterium]